MRAKGFLAEFGEGGEFRRGHSEQGCRWQKVPDTQSPFSKGAESWKVPGGSLPKGALKQIPKDQRRDPLISRFRESRFSRTRVPPSAASPPGLWATGGAGQN